jgi:hypothetical protein
MELIKIIISDILCLECHILVYGKIHKLLPELSVSFYVIPQHINSNDPFYCDLSNSIVTICTGVAIGNRYKKTFTS